MSMIPGLTINSLSGGNGPNPSLQPGGSVQFGSGNPIPVNNLNGSPAGNVLGIGTSQQSNTGGGGGGQQKQNGGWYNGVQYWAPGSGPQNNNNNNQSQSPSISDQINSSYQPAIDALNSWIGQLGQQQQTQTNNLTQTRDQNYSDLANQQGEQNTNLSNTQQQFGNQAQSAWDQAVQAYNQLQQGAINQFGGASSAGAGIAGLLANQAQQNLGQLTNQKVSALQQFGLEGQKIQDYFTQQHNSVSQQYNSSLADLNKGFQDQMNAIHSQIGQTEAQKTTQKLDLLAQAQSTAQQLAAQYDQSRLQLGASMADMMTRVTGTQFSAQDFSHLFSGLQSTLNSVGGPATAQSPNIQGLVGNIYGNVRDQLGGLTGGNQNQSQNTGSQALNLGA